MDRVPVNETRRRRFEFTVRIVDMLVYAAILVGGLYSLLWPSARVAESLLGYEWLVLLWAILLLGGGLVGFIGRLTRYWLVETPGTVAAFFGITIYFVVLGQYAFVSVTATTAAALVLVALAAMLRRWLELQIFGSEPDATIRNRVVAAIIRRTGDTVPRAP